MKNRSRTHTPVDLENQICIGELTEIRDVVDWCTKILLDTPLAPLITADPAIEVIERDIMLRPIWNWLNLKIAAGAVI